MNTSTPDEIHIHGGILSAILASTLGAFLYGIFGPMIPLIVVKIAMFLGAFVIGYILFSLLKSALPLRLIGALIASGASLAGLWFGWYWHEFGLEAAQGFILSGPEAMYKRLYTLSFQYEYAFGRSGSELVSGRVMTLAIWIGESAAVMSGPIFGALARRDAGVRGWT